MSADPPRKAYKYTCNMIRPQIYSEKSLMESVVDFFSDVVPQAYTGTQKTEDKEKIQWVRFENCDSNDVCKNPDLYRSDTKGLPLLLILGYSNGVQIWYITPNGEAQEILSTRQGPVRICRILSNPDPVLGNSDCFSSKRPLAVMCDSSSAGQPYCGVKFVSLKTGDEVHSVSFKTLPVQNIECNKRFLVIVFLEKVCVHEACQFQQLFWITSCYPCPGPTVNPIALSTRWLAYADKRLVAMHQSCGGMSGDGSQSYAATVISAAKGAFKGLSMFGEAMVNSVTGCKPPTIKRECVQLDNGNRPGIVTVVDIQNIHNDHFNVNEDNEGDGLIAHFHAHANEPVANMAFDPTGTLLVTACKLGHNFHVFRLMAHPVSSSLGAVHHLYTLHRGETTAKVIDISFNHDSRWITVSSHRGTTHLFPITPYGGPVNIRTHSKPHVVNRASRFHRSAGLDEFDHAVGRRSPVLSTSPSSSGQYDRYPTLIQQNTLNNNMGNPRLPPYPHPITIYPAFQIKQPLNVALNPGNKNQSPSHSPTGLDNVYCVCAKFCTPRLCVIGSPKSDVERRDGGKRPVDSLFVMVQSGTLVEYVLEPRAKSVSDKVTDDCLLELNVVGRMQWNLQRLKNSLELRPPLPSNSPLILANEAVTSQVPTAPDLYDLPGLTRQDSKDSLSSEHSSKDDSDEQWLSQVEIITHAGPHRRLWMGPQFSFKTYQENTTVLSSNSSSLLSQSPESNMAAMDMMGDEGDLESLKLQPTRSNPVSMPNARPAYRRLSGSDSPSTVQCVGAQSVPLLIEAGSFDQSPHLLDVYSNWTESTVSKQPRGSDDLEEDRLKETLADAMVESPCKDLEKLSLRHQDIPRPSVKAEKARGQAGRRVAAENIERVEPTCKKVEAVCGKSEVESCANEKQDKLPQESSKTGKKGQGTPGKQNKKVDEKVVTERFSVKISEAVRSSPEKVDATSIKSKNGKMRKNSKKSSDSGFASCSRMSSANKEDEDADLGNVKVGKQKANITGDDVSAKACAEMNIAKDVIVQIQNEEHTTTIEKQNSVNDTEINTKSKTMAELGSAIGTLEVAELHSDDNENDLKTREGKGKNEQKGNKSNDEFSNSNNQKPFTEPYSMKYDSSEKNQALCHETASVETLSLETETLSIGKSKKRNKKSSKNLMKESVSEKVSDNQTEDMCEKYAKVNSCKKSYSKEGTDTFEIPSRVAQNSVGSREVRVELFVENGKCEKLQNEMSDTESGVAAKQEDKNLEKRESKSSVLGKDESKTEIDRIVNTENKNKDRSESKLSNLEVQKKRELSLSDQTLLESPNSTGFSAASKKKKKKEIPCNNELTVTKQVSLSKVTSEINCEKEEVSVVGDQKSDSYISQHDDPEQRGKVHCMHEDAAKTAENEIKVDNKSSDFKLASSESIPNPCSDSSESFVEVKSKRKFKKKNNGMNYSAVEDYTNDNEKQQLSSLKEQDTLKDNNERISEIGNEAKGKFHFEMSSDTILPHKKEGKNAEMTKTKESSVEIKSSAVVIEECSKVGNCKSSKKLVDIDDEGSEDGTVQNSSVKEKKNEEKTRKERLDRTDVEMKKESKEFDEAGVFVVPKKKNKRKKKSEEPKQGSSKSSSEAELSESQTQNSPKLRSVSEKNKDQNLDKELMKNKSVSEAESQMSNKQAEEGVEKITNENSLEEFKFNEKNGVKEGSSFESEDDNMILTAKFTKNKNEECDEVIEMSEEKRMEDSAESGSKYETAESAEDDPSAWERSEFEECMGENNSEHETAVESSSSLSYGENRYNSEEKMHKFFAKYKGESSVNKSKFETEMAVNEIKGKEMTEAVGKDIDNENLWLNQNVVNKDETNVGTGRSDTAASSIDVSIYDESAGSSSRSSEEREVTGGGKSGAEKQDSKNKKKKRKNKK